MKSSQDALEQSLTDAYQQDDDRQFTDRVMSQIHATQIEATPLAQRWITLSILAAAACLVLAAAGVFGFYQNSLSVKEASTDHGGQTVRGSETPGEVVMLQVTANEHAQQRLAKSDYLPKDFVLLLGRFKNPRGSGAARTVELQIDRVLKGNLAGGKIVTRDELPAFCCQGPTVASEIYPAGQPLLCWLTREKGRWVLQELQKSTPRFMAVFNAVTAKDPAKELLPLVTPHGFDFETTEIVKLFGDPAKITPLMKDILKQTPALLRPLQGAPGPGYDKRWQKRMKLVSQRLSPCLDILARFTQYKDGAVIDLILPCYPPLQDEGGDSLRFALNYHLSSFCSTAAYKPAELELDPAQIRGIRHIFAAEIASFGEKWSPSAATACSGVVSIADQTVVDLLLKEQSRRPVVASHATITNTLGYIYASPRSDASVKASLAASWLSIIDGLSAEDIGEHPLAESHAAQFAKAIAGNLVRADLTHAQREMVRHTYHTTKTPWVKSALAWQVEKPAQPAEDADGEAIAYQFGEAFVARYTKDARPSADVTRQVSQWDGPHMLKVSRSQHATAIVASLNSAEIVDLSLSYTKLSPELLAAIGQLTSLQTILFHGCDVPDPDAIKHLTSLKQLKRLTISSTTIKTAEADAAEHLAKIASLEQLYLDQVGPLEDSSLASLVALKKLESLRLTSQQVTNEGLMKFLLLKQLQSIVLPQILLEPDLIDAFQQAGVSVFPLPKTRYTQVWDTATGKQVLTSIHTGRPVFTAGGKLLAVEEGADAVGLYSTDTGARQRELKKPALAEWSISPTGQAFITRNGKQLTIHRNNPPAVQISAAAANGMFAVFPLSEKIATADARGINIYNTRDGKLLRQLTVSRGGFFSPGHMRVSMDEKLLAAAGNGHPGICVWRLSDGKLVHRVNTGSVLFGFAGNRLLYCEADKKTLRSLDIASGKSSRVLDFPPQGNPLFYALQEEHFAFAASARPVIVHLHETTTWKLKRKFRFDNDATTITSLDLSPDGERLVVAGNADHLAGD